VPRFQSLARVGVKIVPRGWSAVFKAAARVFPPFREYEIDLSRGGTLIVDLRYKMCAPYVLYAGLPHERGLDTLMRYLVRPGDVCVDVGASIGYYTCLLSDLVGPNGLVFAYEPIPAALQILRRNVEGRKNVRVVDAALSDRAGQAEFFIASAEDMSSLAPDPERVCLQVRLETLDEVVRRVSQADFIKIDVEGFEYTVLRGGEKLLRRFRPTIVFELTKRYIDQFGHDIDDFRGLLEPLGYTLHWLNHMGEGRHLLGTDRSNDVVAVPPQRMGAFV
jgi:FkbM family methyltransferase